MRVDRIARVDRATAQRDAATGPRPTPSASSALPDEPPGQRPGAGGRRLRASTRSGPGVDLCDPASPLRLEPAPGRRAAARRSSPRPGSGSTTPASRGSSRPWRFVDRRPPVGVRARPPALTGRPRWTQRSIALLEFPAVRDAPRRARPRSRRRAGWPRRSSRRTTRSSSPAPSTRPTRPARCSRSGRASASARPTTSARRSSGRPAAAGSTRPSSSRSPTRSTRRPGWPTLLADERRPLLRELGARAPRAAGAALDAGPQLRSGRRAARHGVAAPRRPARGGPGRLRPAAAAARRARRLGARRRPPGADHHAPQRPLRRAGQGRGPVAGQGHRPRRVGQRPDAVHRAARRRRARQRLARGAGRRGRRRSRGSSTSCRRSSRPTRTPLRETLDALARFDFWAAKAQLAAEMRRQSAPRPPTGPRSSCCRRRHPGLTGRVVPIDIRLGDGYTALVVTGPNTGGKTVTLRTLGLLSLMHQAGLHVPADAGSRLPIFRDVFADIGDEQSIAQSLSTFSGHLRSITRIVEAAGPGHARPARRARRRAPTRPRARRWPRRCSTTSSGPAPWSRRRPTTPSSRPTPTRRRRPATPSVEFDLETLSPTYRLTIGLPGGSQAFAIAERLGLARADRRRRPVAPVRERSGRSRRRWPRSGRPRARRARRSTGPAPPSCAPPRRCAIAEEERRRARQRAGRARSGRRGTRRSGSSTTCATRSARPAARRSSARRSPRRRSTPPSPAPRASSAGCPAEATAEPPRRSPSPRDVAARRAGPQPVGRLGGPDRGARARRQAGDARGRRDAGHGRRRRPRAVARPATVGAARGGRRAATPPNASAAARSIGPGSVASSLDLRGARVDEALEALGRYLDDAALAGLDKVLIIHGLGTGALRDAVRAEAGEPSAGQGRPARANAAKAATGRRSSSSSGLRRPPGRRARLRRLLGGCGVLPPGPPLGHGSARRRSGGGADGSACANGSQRPAAS